jgi:hypothetical protein
MIAIDIVFWGVDFVREGKMKNLGLLRDALGHKSIVNTERYTGQ